MKRRLICAAMALSFVLLAACGAQEAPPSPTPDANAMAFTRENFPRLDGSTATAPLGRAIAAGCWGRARTRCPTS